MPLRLRSNAALAGGLAVFLLTSAARSGDTSPPPVHQSRPQKISELVADLGYGADAKHIDTAIPFLAAGVAPGDPVWNSTSRRWAAVCALVARSLHKDAQGDLAESEVNMVNSAERAMTDGVVNDDLDAALQFFHSDTGRRFLAFQDTLMDLSIEVSLAADPQGSGVSVENLDARKRTLELWFPMVFARAILPPSAADQAIDNLYRRFSRLRGPQLDSLAQRVADDLPKFEEFVRSAPFRRIIVAQKLGEQKASPPDLAAFFATEGKLHAAEWHAAYAGS